LSRTNYKKIQIVIVCDKKEIFAESQKM